MEQFTLLIFLIFLFFLIFFFFLSSLKKFSKEKRQGKKNLPPSPWKLPLIGNLHQIGSTPHQSFLRLSKKHGPLMLLQLGSIPTLVVSSGDALQSIFKSHDKIFSNRPILRAVTKFSFDNSNISFAQYGERWRHARKLCVRELLSGRRVRDFRPIREEEIGKLIADIDSGMVDLSDKINGFSYDVLCRAVFGGGRGRFHGVMAETERIAAGFCVGDFFPGWDWVDGISGYREKVERIFGELNGFFDLVIEEHLNREEEKEIYKEDLVDVLLRLHKEAIDGAFLSSMNHVKGILAGNVYLYVFCFVLFDYVLGGRGIA